MMELKHWSSSILLLFLLVGLSSSAHISDDVFESHSTTGRSLLQAKKACPVNFEFLNYTVITSQCKGPKFPAKECCGSFKEFACPYAEEINDLTTDCASTMFSYINLYGRYPPGLFSSECREGKEGLACPDGGQLSTSQNESNGQMITSSSLKVLAAVGFLVLLVLL